MDLSGFLAEWNDAARTLTVRTSGSTGAPRPITVSKRKMLASARTTCDFLGLKEGDSALLCLPLDYIAGKMMVVRSIERGLELTAVAPGSHPFASLPDGTEPFDLVAMVPSQVYCSLQVPREARMLSVTKHLIIGGGAVSRELSEALAGFPNAVWSTYGMTETLSHIALRRLNGEGRSGWYEAFDGVGLSLGEDSCLVIDAPAVCDTVLRTNDIAELAEDGRRFRIIGRRDNVICSGGLKLQIEKIEEELSEYLKIPFCVTKRPDAEFGEAAVLLVEDGASCDADSLARQVRSAVSHLDRYSRPKEVRTVPRIPLTGTGKTDRSAAARIIASGRTVPGWKSR